MSNHVIKIHAVPTPGQRSTILAAAKWLERIHDRKEMLPASFLDNTDPLPIAKELRKMLANPQPTEG
jgi:hypothetical protein